MNSTEQMILILFTLVQYNAWKKFLEIIYNKIFYVEIYRLPRTLSNYKRCYFTSSLAQTSSNYKSVALLISHLLIIVYLNH
jgi:hypothetical protein